MPAGRLRLGLATIGVLIAFAPAGDADTVPDDPAPLAIGVVPQRSYDDSDAKRMNAAGIGSVRVWFSWAQVEGTRGAFDWGQLDERQIWNEPNLSSFWGPAVDPPYDVPDIALAFDGIAVHPYTTLREFTGA